MNLVGKMLELIEIIDVAINQLKQQIKVGGDCDSRPHSFDPMQQGISCQNIFFLTRAIVPVAYSSWCHWFIPCRWD